MLYKGVEKLFSKMNQRRHSLWLNQDNDELAEQLKERKPFQQQFSSFISVNKTQKPNKKCFCTVYHSYFKGF